MKWVLGIPMALAAIAAIVFGVHLFGEYDLVKIVVAGFVCLVVLFLLADSMGDWAVEQIKNFKRNRNLSRRRKHLEKRIWRGD